MTSGVFSNITTFFLKYCDYILMTFLRKYEFIIATTFFLKYYNFILKIRFFPSSGPDTLTLSSYIICCKFSCIIYLYTATVYVLIVHSK